MDEKRYSLKVEAESKDEDKEKVTYTFGNITKKDLEALRDFVTLVLRL